MPEVPLWDFPCMRYAAAGAAALAGLVALYGLAVGASALVRFWRNRRGGEPPRAAEPLDLERIAPTGPPVQGPSLAFYNLPVRLAVLVLAPVGRGNPAPTTDELPAVVDAIAPGLFAVVAAHGTHIKVWPPQLSTQGFAQALFANIRLPGQRGKGTPWCAVAGRFTSGERAILAGLVLRAAAPNNLSQVTLAQETDWLAALRCSQ